MENVITLKETSENRLTQLIKNQLQKNKGAKFILVTKINNIKQINRLQKFPVLDIIDYSSKNIQDKINTTKTNYNTIKGKSVEIKNISNEKEFEQKLSRIHVFVGIYILYYILIKYIY